MSKAKTGLGRGLSALMADIDESLIKTKKNQGTSATSSTSSTRGKGAKTKPAVKTTAKPNVKSVKDRPTLIPIEKIKPNPAQPRRDFAKDSLAELASSIKTHGIIQPILVREVGKGYQIIAGERRWRAAQQAKLHEIPVLIRDYSDSERLQISIIENIQRADLNAVEEAMAYHSLMEKFGHTQEELSAALGKSRPYIANSLRLLSLPRDVLTLLSSGRLSAGHARLLIGYDLASTLAKEIVKEGFSVRDVEVILKQVKSGGDDDGGGAGVSEPTARRGKKPKDTIDLEQRISASLGFRTQIQHGTKGQRGQVVISYRTLEELDDLSERLTKP